VDLSAFTLTGQAKQKRSPLWPGLLLNLLLPGSGFSYLNRPWWHLGGLALTTLNWLAAWTLVLKVGNRQISSRTALAPPMFTSLVLLGLLMALAAYVLLTWSYLRLHNSLNSNVSRPGLNWSLIALHFLLVLCLIWFYYH
jgi:hypothetical protein